MLCIKCHRINCFSILHIDSFQRITDISAVIHMQDIDLICVLTCFCNSVTGEIHGHGTVFIPCIIGKYSAVCIIKCDVVCNNGCTFVLFCISDIVCYLTGHLLGLHGNAFGKNTFFGIQRDGNSVNCLLRMERRMCNFCFHCNCNCNIFFNILQFIGLICFTFIGNRCQFFICCLNGRNHIFASRFHGKREILSFNNFFLSFYRGTVLRADFISHLYRLLFKIRCIGNV